MTVEVTCCGGWSKTMNADEETQKICDELKPQVEEQANNKYAEFSAVKYKKQMVNGYKYLIKVHVGGEDYVHLNVLEAFTREPGLHLRGVFLHKNKDDLL